jgi:hypothetical protein
MRQVNAQAGVAIPFLSTHDRGGHREHFHRTTYIIVRNATLRRLSAMKLIVTRTGAN